MKPVTLYWFVRGVTHERKFKWEYRVVWTYGGKPQSSADFEVLHSRSDARRYKKSIWSALKPRIQRRLVQTTWEDYSDTFTYNAKGNGNGR